jgi:hypothetical protein
VAHATGSHSYPKGSYKDKLGKIKKLAHKKKH